MHTEQEAGIVFSVNEIKVNLSKSLLNSEITTLRKNVTCSISIG